MSTPQALPPGVAAVNLTGRYVAPDGTPLQGTITFTPPSTLILPGADTISMTSAVVPLDMNGQFSVWLIATDNPGMSPQNWTYRVTPNIRGMKPPSQPYHIMLPRATSPVDIADISRPSPSSGQYLPVVGPAGPRGPEGPAGPNPAPHRLLVFYAPPISITTVGVPVGPNTVEHSALILTGWDHVVLGAGLQDQASPHHASTTAIIQRMRALNPRTRVYGYIDLGMVGASAHGYSMTTLKSMVDEWFATGAHGIFLDQAGYAYQVTRARLNELLDYVHTKSDTSGAIVNDFDADSVMGATVDPAMNPSGAVTHMGPRDAYLLESWAANTDPAVGYTDGYNSAAEIKRRGDLAAAYRAGLGVQLFTANIVEYERLDAATSEGYFKTVEALAMIYALDAYDGASNIYYSAATAAVDLDLRYTPLVPSTLVPTAAPQWSAGLTEVSRPDLGITVHLEPGASPAPVYWSRTPESELRRPHGTAGGDLSGSFPAPVVKRVNGVLVTGTPTAGQVPTATGGTAAAWATPPAIPTTLPPSGTAGGDLTGSYPAPTVKGVRGVTVSATAPTAGQVLTATSGSAAAFAALPAAPTTLPPSGPATGDLSGSYPAPTVQSVNGVLVTNAPAPAAGAVLKANSASSASWTVEPVLRLDQLASPTAAVGLNAQKIVFLAAGTAPTDAANVGQLPTTLPPSGTATGDLSGTYPSPVVARINGTAVPAAPTAGQVLTATSGTAAAWTTPAASLPPSGAAGGDLSGTYPNPGVGKLAGVAVSGTPTAGQVLTASSGTAAAWSTLPRLDQIPAAGGDVALAGHRITGLTNGSSASDAAAFGQIPVAGTGAANYAAGNDARITGALQAASNLSDLASATTARTNLGLGGAAVLGVGTAAGTVAAGDDARITGAAQKASNLSDLANATTARTNLGLGGAAILNVGTAAGTVAAGNDSRIVGAAQIAGDLGGTAAAPKVVKIDNATLAGFAPIAGWILTATSSSTAGWGPLPTLNTVPQPTGNVNMNNWGFTNLGNTTLGFAGGSISFFGAAQVTKPTTGAIAAPTDPVVLAILNALTSLGLITNATT
ncbi:hypothetical protein ACFVGM_08895 [Kitasatospora purpeofusca]|uniref:hypothetical protein n=1 Tax=Kitasatospora purpeofusca TaxID=67352 RepID=UPI0036C0095C